MVEENHRLQVLAHGYTSTIEVDDFRSRSSTDINIEFKPDLSTGLFVSIYVLRNFDPTPVPKALSWPLGVYLGYFPGGIIKSRIFAVRQIRGMHFPLRRRQLVQSRQLFHRILRAGRQLLAAL